MKMQGQKNYISRRSSQMDFSECLAQGMSSAMVVHRAVSSLGVLMICADLRDLRFLLVMAEAPP